MSTVLIFMDFVRLQDRGVALDCIHHKGMHVQEDYFYPEVLNPTDHTPCKDGETGELVFTTLVKRRYAAFALQNKRPDKY